MQPFTVHRGLIAPLDRSNVDTDQIIPKDFLKSIRRTGFGEALFYDWRYLPDGRPNPEFSLNLPRFRGATILVARNNFGCGSSREHAVWAIQQYGFRAVIAPWVERGGVRVPAFADIFRNNSRENGLLTVELSEPEVDEIFRWIHAVEGLEATIDLPAQTVTLHVPGQEITYRFDIDAATKEYLIRGLDSIGLTLELSDRIEAFEKQHDVQMPSLRKP